MTMDFLRLELEDLQTQSRGEHEREDAIRSELKIKISLF